MQNFRTLSLAKEIYQRSQGLKLNPVLKNQGP